MDTVEDEGWIVGFECACESFEHGRRWDGGDDDRGGDGDDGLDSIAISFHSAVSYTSSLSSTP